MTPIYESKRQTKSAVPPSYSHTFSVGQYFDILRVTPLIVQKLVSFSDAQNWMKNNVSIMIFNEFAALESTAGDGSLLPKVGPRYWARNKK